MKSSHAVRIITCCYCGARSTLKRSKERDLVCHGCGAPIQKLEGLQPILERMPKTSGAAESRKKQPIPHRAERPHQHLDKDRPSRRKKGKRRKKRSMWYHVREAFDDIDDIFDIFD